MQIIDYLEWYSKNYTWNIKREENYNNIFYILIINQTKITTTPSKLALAKKYNNF